MPQPSPITMLGGRCRVSRILLASRSFLLLTLSKKHAHSTTKALSVGKIMPQNPRERPKGNHSTYFWGSGRYFTCGSPPGGTCGHSCMMVCECSFERGSRFSATSRVQVYCVDADRRARVVSQLKSGIVWENCSQAGACYTLNVVHSASEMACRACKQIM